MACSLGRCRQGWRGSGCLLGREGFGQQRSGAMMGTKVFSSQTLSLPCYKTGKDELAVLPRHTKVVERYLVFFCNIYTW